ncbi:MAG: PAS domain S-box protein, partial [Flavobacteriales bacterium]|nr:PAS domain S-box protein [Flavobacteriales bacterium]
MYAKKFLRFGLLFGACFPLMAWALDLYLFNKEFALSSIAEIHHINKIHWIVDLAPFVLGAVFYLMGKQVEKNYNKQVEYGQELESKILKIEELEKWQHSLLEKSSELILVIDDQKKIKYASPSVESVLQFQEKDLISSSLNHLVNQISLDSLNRYINDSINNPNDELALENFQFIKKDQSEICIEIGIQNFLDDQLIKGIILNCRDISERIRAEKEQEMRSKMQSLSENSPDIIVRIDKNEVVRYANPAINGYCSASRKEILDRSLSELEGKVRMVEMWKSFMNKAKDTGDKQAIELHIPMSDMEVDMHISAIPEKNDDGDLESLLIVHHDITEQKKQEKKLALMNKRISDSINYSKRIQKSIIPSIESIQMAFPKSFIWYEAKDVVSGDIPYFFENDSHYYIAVIDCTGHGVPGAMLSIIGNLLLTDILNDNIERNTAEILDLFHARLVATLKQDTINKNVADGMDVALCKIDKSFKELDYAGAHRPLFLKT